MAPSRKVPCESQVCEVNVAYWHPKDEKNGIRQTAEAILKRKDLLCQIQPKCLRQEQGCCSFVGTTRQSSSPSLSVKRLIFVCLYCNCTLKCKDVARQLPHVFARPNHYGLSAPHFEASPASIDTPHSADATSPDPVKSTTDAGTDVQDIMVCASALDLDWVIGLAIEAQSGMEDWEKDLREYRNKIVVLESQNKVWKSAVKGEREKVEVLNSLLADRTPRVIESLQGEVAALSSKTILQTQKATSRSMVDTGTDAIFYFDLTTFTFNLSAEREEDKYELQGCRQEAEFLRDCLQDSDERCSRLKETVLQLTEKLAQASASSCIQTCQKPPSAMSSSSSEVSLNASSSESSKTTLSKESSAYSTPISEIRKQVPLYVPRKPATPVNILPPVHLQGRCEEELETLLLIHHKEVLPEKCPDESLKPSPDIKGTAGCSTTGHSDPEIKPTKEPIDEIDEMKYYREIDWRLREMEKAGDRSGMESLLFDEFGITMKQGADQDFYGGTSMVLKAFVEKSRELEMFKAVWG
ncbi:hypothetical protein BJ508DRAFT_380371 [Ascobolus immersus RN42]|uniref:Uncharacterized protein n=1 Tax=Ascobolus immersus RN42 TaxID=1160509 RepID=A0A3N4HS08_ASCIM|nr:hypothetical protein BJ508DRAFT_380371 [Ascobolus immersus RN42]